MSALGDFFSGLGGGIVSTVQGIGDSFGAQAEYNSALAAQIQANAANTSQALALQAEAQKRKDQNTLIIIALAFGVPALVLGLYLILK